jgi:thiamine biosynthesis lipoprotein
MNAGGRAWRGAAVALTVAAVAWGAGGGCGGKKKQLKKAQEVAAAAAVAALPVRHEFVMPGLGGDFRVVVYVADQAAGHEAERVVFERLTTLEIGFDEERADSDITQLHANAGLGAVRVSDDVYQFLKQAVAFAAESDNAVDVTAGAYARLWHETASNDRTLTEQDMAAADAVVGIDKLRLDPISREAFLTATGMRLELGGWARAFAADWLLQSLSRAGFPVAMVDVGGRIALGDAPPGTDGWRIRVNNAPRGSKERVLRLSRQGVASSGVAGDVVEVNGRRYARLLNPQTGVGATNLAAATVVARRAWQADALARAAAVLGEPAGGRLVSKRRGARVWYHAPPAGGAKSRPAQPLPQPAAPTTDALDTDLPDDDTQPRNAEPQPATAPLEPNRPDVEPAPAQDPG